MRPRTRDEMDSIVRGLVYDCISLAADANLAQVDIARMVGTTRLTVHKWQKHLDAGGGRSTLPVSGATAALTFLNLLITKRLLELGLANGDLPRPTQTAGRRWVDANLADNVME